MENNSIKAGHETTDANAKGVFLAGIGLIVGCALVMLVVLEMVRLFQREHDDENRAMASGEIAPSVAGSIDKFPAPRLQVAPEADLAALRAREDTVLQHYGWIDKQAGVVRLPIERAMDLIAQRGLPYRGQTGAPAPTRTFLQMQQARPQQIETPPAQFQ